MAPSVSDGDDTSRPLARGVVSSRLDVSITALALVVVGASLAMRVVHRGQYYPGWDVVGAAHGLHLVSTKAPGDLLRFYVDSATWTTHPRCPLVQADEHRSRKSSSSPDEGCAHVSEQLDAAGLHDAFSGQLRRSFSARRSTASSARCA